jgi:hypothetical protein
MPSVPEIITDSILKQLEQGVAPWRKPWSASIPCNLISKKPYRGLNVFLLATQGYGSPYWLTFNQAKQLGAHVRQGEKSTLVSFWKFNEYAKENRETGETENKTSALLRYYRVFNVEQCEGLKALNGDDHKAINPTAECESIVQQVPNAPRIGLVSVGYSFRLPRNSCGRRRTSWPSSTRSSHHRPNQFMLSGYDHPWKVDRVHRISRTPFLSASSVVCSPKSLRPLPQ